MVFNSRVSDSDLIERLGGSSALARRLGYPLLGGVQRVQNWKRRGIPPRVKLEWPELFLAPLSAEVAGQPEQKERQEA